MLLTGHYLPSTTRAADATDLLGNLVGDRKAISVTISSFAQGVSGKLETGDVVSAIVYSQKDGLTFTPPELQYLMVITSTTNQGVTCLIIAIIGIVLLLGLTPDRVTNDILRLSSPRQTLREKILIAKGKKKSRKLTVELNRIRDALIATGKENSFTLICAASLFLMILGCALAVAIGNVFLIPVLALAFALLPFGYARRTIRYYETHLQEELETTLSIITTSYIRSDDIVTAVKENLTYLKPPVKDIFAGFLAENAMISANIKESIRHLKEKVNNSIFQEWCYTLTACQDDRTLKETLMPIVAKLTDVRLANGEIQATLSAARTEYYMMAGMVVANIPLLYVLNKDWYHALMDTVPGKLALAVCGMAILVTYLFMNRFTKPIAYQK